MPKFSIIIPVYNVAPYLRECLDSVLAQTFTDWEAICVDDGSTDGSGVILDEYAIKDSRFKILHQPNAGVSTARNVALDIAKGSWIGFVDGDDRVGVRWLSTVVRAINEHAGVDVVRTSWSILEGDLLVPNVDMLCKRGVEITGCEAKRNLFSQVARCAFSVIHFIRRECVRNVRYEPAIHFREDALFLFNIALRCEHLLYIDDCNYVYRRSRDGNSHSIGRSYGGTYFLFQEYLKFWAFASQWLLNQQCVKYSTLWMTKNLVEWYRFCQNLDCRMSWKVWLITWRAVRVGAFNPFRSGRFAHLIRALLYLCNLLYYCIQAFQEAVRPAIL